MHLEALGALKIPQKILAKESKLEAINTHLLAQGNEVDGVGTKNECRHNQVWNWTPETEQLLRVT